MRMKETLGESLAAVGCRDGGWSPPAQEQLGVWGDFRLGLAAQDYPQLPHGTAATPTQSLKTALTQSPGAPESQAWGKIPVQGLGKGFLLTSRHRHGHGHVYCEIQAQGETGKHQHCLGLKREVSAKEGKSLP